MLRRPRPLLVAGLAALVVGAPVAAYADGVTSRSDATALTVAVADNGQDSGTVTATYDGQESVSGETTPAIPSGGFVELGVLTQQATATNGRSAACAGVAGAGGGVVQIGDGSCLTPGDTVSGSLTDLSLDGLGLEAPPTDELPPELVDALEPVLEGADQLDAVRDQVDAAIDQVRGPLEEQFGELGLVARFDAIEGRCTVDDGQPSGSASIANAGVVLVGGGQTLPVVSLPANPPPNTEVVTDLSDVLDVLLGAVSTQLQVGLDGALADVDEAVVAQLREQLVAGVRDNLEDQLAPLEENLLRITLNEQTRPTSDSIRVTALHAQVLPAAAEAIDAPLVDARVGAVGCGPADRVVSEAAPAPEPEAAPPPAAQPRIPTAVSAGVAGERDEQGLGLLPWLTLAVGAGAAGAAGWSALRRHRA
ncbi:hypothetical protein [Nocardioides aequoreus]|uniref:hypothetical protein n=1 Tax=Nocardioides aequoreus TaxID=397278 RepID=UPI0004C39B63|nr:hypothetical protein [Nocardioides aequoreus]